jgi:hypothetical protein
MEWLLALLFGTGATFSPNPTTLPAGEVFMLAPKPLKPVSNGLRVNIGIGLATADTKSAVLSGSLKIGDYGNLQVAVCRSKDDCVTLDAAGTFFSKENYGFAFSGVGPEFRGSRFIGVKITAGKVMPKVVVSWNNFLQ